MELCDKTSGDVIKEFDKESNLKTNGTLTTVSYYIEIQIFIQILEGVNYLQKKSSFNSSRLKTSQYFIEII
jgi:hypothetical protein